MPYNLCLCNTSSPVQFSLASCKRYSNPESCKFRCANQPTSLRLFEHEGSGYPASQAFPGHQISRSHTILWEHTVSRRQQLERTVRRSHVFSCSPHRNGRTPKQQPILHGRYAQFTTLGLQYVNAAATFNLYIHSFMHASQQIQGSSPSTVDAYQQSAVHMRLCLT